VGQGALCEANSRPVRFMAALRHKADSGCAMLQAESHMQDAGAPHAMCAGGRNALHLAARSCNVDMLRLLVGGEDAAADAAYVNEPDRNGITALFLAMQKGAAQLRRRTAAQQTVCSPPAEAGK